MIDSNQAALSVKVKTFREVSNHFKNNKKSLKTLKIRKTWDFKNTNLIIFVEPESTRRAINMMTVLFQLSLLADGTPNLLATLLETSR